MAIVVSDTSPLRCLHHLKLLDVLSRLFGNVLIPPAVADELKVERSGIVSLDPAVVRGVEIRTPTDTKLVQQLLTRLHLGESEALALAVEVNALCAAG